MRDAKNDWNVIDHTYTEADFHACLLVHGWHCGMENPEAYWYSIDLWFKDAWPNRYVTQQPTGDHSGQMEFKLQFFSWVRRLGLPQVIYTAV